MQQPVAPRLPAGAPHAKLDAMNTPPKGAQRRAVLIATLAGPLAGCAQALGFGTGGSGRIVHAEFDVAPFSALEFGGDAQVTLVQNRTPRIAIDVDDNLLPLFEPRSEGGTLNLRFRESARPTKIAIAVHVWNLESLSLGGSAHLQADALVARRLLLRAGGSVLVRLPDLTAETVELQLSGSVDVRMGGQANELAFRMGGSTRLDATAFQARRVQADMGGSSHARVRAGETLSGSMGGSSLLRWRGEAKVNVARGGSARIDPE